MVPFSTRFRTALVALTPDRAEESIKALGELYDPAVVFRDPIQVVRGRDEFLALNRRLLKRMRTLTWVVTSEMGTDEEVFLEWTMRGAPSLGPALEVSGVTRARVRDGLVYDHRDYWDMGELIASALPGGSRILQMLRLPFA